MSRIGGARSPIETAQKISPVTAHSEVLSPESPKSFDVLLLIYLSFGFKQAVNI